jgi:hypothetical protein
MPVAYNVINHQGANPTNEREQIMTTKLSAKEAAAELGTDARTLRKFIRGAKNLPISPVGQGARYEFTPKEVKSLKKAFLAWSSGSKTKTKSIDDQIIDLGGVENPEDGGDLTEEPEITEEDLDEDEKELDALEDLEGPTDEELDDLDIEEIEVD